MNELASFQATVHGLVQGVFFRTYTSRTAQELGLAGYVRNLPDGSVEVQAEGQKDKLEKLTGFLKVGPPGARVEKVIMIWAEYAGDYSGFTVRY